MDFLPKDSVMSFFIMSELVLAALMTVVGLITLVVSRSHGVRFLMWTGIVWVGIALVIITGTTLAWAFLLVGGVAIFIWKRLTWHEPRDAPKSWGEVFLRTRRIAVGEDTSKWGRLWRSYRNRPLPPWMQKQAHGAIVEIDSLPWRMDDCGVLRLSHTDAVVVTCHRCGQPSNASLEWGVAACAHCGSLLTMPTPQGAN